MNELYDERNNLGDKANISLDNYNEKSNQVLKEVNDIE
jgi:hypothetical protein